MPAVNLDFAPSGANSAEIADTPSVRVLHLNAGNLYGGVETLLTTLAKLRPLCPSMEPQFAVCFEGRFSQELAAAGVPVHLLGGVRISRPWTVWRARRRLRELLKQERFDLVVCHMGWSLVVFLPAARRAGCKVALWAHGFTDTKNWLERLVCRLRPDLAIANSRFTAASVRNHFRGTPVQVIYCPVALEETPTADQWRTALRQEQGVDTDTAVILQVSRMESWKGHLLHLDALSRLKTKGKWVCWIAGGPQQENEQKYFRQLQQRAIQLGIAERVRFLGQRSDVPKLLAAADVFCQPNQAPEPFGIVFIEALWAGRPVVSTALGGALEIIDESCGLLAKPGDADSLAEELSRLIESPELRCKLGRSGPARARALCDPAPLMKELAELSQLEVSRCGGK